MRNEEDASVLMGHDGLGSSVGLTLTWAWYNLGTTFSQVLSSENCFESLYIYLTKYCSISTVAESYTAFLQCARPSVLIV